jgi:hypothetical protein
LGTGLGHTQGGLTVVKPENAGPVTANMVQPDSAKKAATTISLSIDPPL